MSTRTNTNYNLFAMSGSDILHDESDLGIINGMLGTNGPYTNTLRIEGLFARPFVSSDFYLEVRLFGQKIKSTEYTWFPVEMKRQGCLDDLAVDSSLVLGGGKRTAVLQFAIENKASVKRKIPLQIDFGGTLDYHKEWNFARPQSSCVLNCRCVENGVELHNNYGSIAIKTDVENMKYLPYCGMFEGEIEIEANCSEIVSVAVAIGYNELTPGRNDVPHWSVFGYSAVYRNTAVDDAEEAITNPDVFIDKGREVFEKKVEHLLRVMPEFTASDQRLQKWYYRSLVHLLLNQWNDVPEFVLNPYFSTGSLNGGCCCSYLWDYGANWKIWGMYKPEAAKKHIKAFLNIDLENHYAFLPMTNQATGPWYYINQEKIIFCIYYYVLHTGDKDFLLEKFRGRSIIEHVVEQALVKDDLDKDAVLVDYGTGNHHLELRTKFRYDNILPDMNLRRCSYYHAADILCKMVDYEAPVDFIKRSNAIKELIREKLYDKEAKWFRWIDAEGNENLRYTIQMFKALGFPEGWTLDKDMHDALISHINEQEFLGEFGMHSMSKLDPAYDQVDIDNGGGGSCVFFGPEIMEKLYLNGENKLAESMLYRFLWWADKMPFWGDSIVANYIDYRKDTPLQNALGGAAIAQSVIFGIFGISVDENMQITINPAPPESSPEISLKNICLANKNFDIFVEGNSYRVIQNNSQITEMPIGKSVII